MKTIPQFVCPKTQTALIFDESNLTIKNTSTSEPIQFEYRNQIPDLCFPLELLEADRKEQLSYNDAYLRYDRGVSWVFESLNKSDEKATRDKMIAMLNLKPGMTVLEVGAGTGKDSALIVEKVAPGGTVFLSDLSPNMLKLAKEKVKSDSVSIEFFIANAAYLPFEDESFDALFHFGGINTFGDISKAFIEMARVVKKGGKIVIGDEAVAPWMYDQESFQILMKANPMFDVAVPLSHVPKNAENFSLHWIFGNAFYVMEFNVGETPKVDVDLPIPNKDFIDNWRIRATKNS